MIFKKIVSATLLLAAAANAAQAQLKLEEKVEKTSANQIIIPFERYSMPNGLTVILHEDKSDPIVHVDVTYHVGSAREEIGKSGFAHFFEHMMFQGSDHVADEQHFKIITEAGGTLNGTTNRDRTNYFETVPSNQLEKMLWLESDRMGFLVNAVTQKKFEVQRGTVKNERGQNYDNKPYGLVGETSARYLYPYGHPYSWLTIGYVEDLNRVNVQDLRNFFLRWYGPNNAVLTIGGDIDKKQTLAWVEKYFGSIPKGPTVENASFPAVVIEKDRYQSMVDNYAKNQMLSVTMPTVPAHHPDEVALDCLAQILGGDNTSVLYQNLVKTQLATRASCSHPTDELAGSFSFSLMPANGVKLSKMEEELRTAIASLARQGITQEQVDKFIASREASMIFNLESVSGKVSQLASNYTFLKNANALPALLQEVKSLTVNDVLRVYNQYIANKPMLILNVHTKDKQSGAAGENNYTVDTSKNIFPIVDYSTMVYNEAKDNFDRNKMPPSGSNPVVKVPTLHTNLKDAASGITLTGHQSQDIPVVNISINLPGGRLLEDKNLSKLGITNIFAQMMDEDTKQHSSEEITTILDKLGSTVFFSPTTDEWNINIRCLSKNLQPTLAIVKEKLLEPKFTQDNLDRIKMQTLSSIKNSKSNANYLASMAYGKKMYGGKTVLGLPSSGTNASVETIGLQDIENHYNTYIGKQGAYIIMVGDYTNEDAKAVMDIAKALPNKKVQVPTPAIACDAKAKTIYIVDVPNAAQTEFRVGYATGLKYDATGEYYKNGLMNYALGGAFNSRINLNLREDKAWTYGARSNFGSSKYAGTYTFSSGIKAQATDSALIEVIKEMTQYAKNGITPEELSFTKNAIGQSDARKYETGGQKAGFISTMLYYKLRPQYVQEQNKILQSINKTQIDALAKKWIKPEAAFIVLAGDKNKIEPKLKALGYSTVSIDSDGNEVK